MLNDKRDKKLK